MFAVDPLPAIVDEALEWGADLLVTHHPLLLRATHSVATDTWKGALLHRMIRGGCALYTAHTNADVAHDGVNDALARTLGLASTGPLRAWPSEPADKIVTFVPPDHADAVIDALRRAGAGTIGNYTGCAWKVSGTGTFTPGEGSNPVIGEVGRTEVTAEARVEMVAPRSRRAAAVEALRAAHPYEEVAVDIIELAVAPSGTGMGRVGSLAVPVSLAAFAQRVADALPSTPGGVRYHGDPEAVVARIAVCGGSGDSLLTDAARAGADVFVTADLRHHPASGALAAGGLSLVDPGHWASEWPWLSVAADRLVQALARRDPSATTVETHISTVVTDPVTGHVRSRPEEDR
jgi:dinuclear metal center YbgI/SA1388 family protein